MTQKIRIESYEGPYTCDINVYDFTSAGDVVLVRTEEIKPGEVKEVLIWGSRHLEVREK